MECWAVAFSQGRLLVTEQFIPKLMVVVALLATVSPLISMNKLYREEKKQRTDHILGRAVYRTRLMGS